MSEQFLFLFLKAVSEYLSVAFSCAARSIKTSPTANHETAARTHRTPLTRVIRPSLGVNRASLYSNRLLSFTAALAASNGRSRPAPVFQSKNDASTIQRLVHVLERIGSSRPKHSIVPQRNLTPEVLNDRLAVFRATGRLHRSGRSPRHPPQHPSWRYGTNQSPNQTRIRRYGQC